MTDQEIILNAISIYDWTFHELEDENKTILLAWGLNQQSKPSVVRIEDFPFTCYVEMPEKIHEQVFDKFVDWLKKALQNDAPINARLYQKKKLYYYRSEKTYPMAKLEFQSLNALRHCERLLAKECSTPLGRRSFPVYEHKISSIRKLLTAKDLYYSGWITGDLQLVDFDLKISHLENEYICSYKTLRRPDPSELSAKITYPTIFSFDIECYSSNPKAMPKKTNSKDVIFAVSCIFSKMGDTNRQKYMIAIGQDLTVQDATLIQVEEEYNLLVELRNLIKKLDPDIVIGYNIFGFDIPYTDFRIQRHMETWNELGRIRGKTTTVKKLSWESSAFGHNDFYQFLGLDGRICLDLLPIVKRDYKLLRYDLDFVSQNFLGKGKFPIKPKQIFGYTKEYNEALATKETDTDRYQKALLDYNKVLDYCVQDSDLVLDLMEKLSMWIGLIELSNIVGVSIVEIFTRGQQIRCLSQIYDLATRENIVIDNRVTKSVMSFSGGFVQEPLPGLYDNVICLDFASLYPSIIMAFNICYTTLLEEETEMEEDKVNHFHIDMDSSEVDNGEEDDILIDELQNIDMDSKVKGNKITAHHRFVKKDVYEGVLPRLVSKLVNERKAVRKTLEGNKDPILKIILDKRQLALKISANSVFGFLGVVNGKLPLMEGAMSITAKGRELIGYVNHYLEEKYKAKIVYNDTDSSMIDLGIKDTKQCNEWGHKLSEEISKLFPPPIKMEYEKGMRMLCLKKKKYAAFLVDKHGNLKTDRKSILVRGIILARRDTLPWLQNVYSELLFNIMMRENMASSLQMIYKAVDELYLEKIDVKGILIVRQLGSYYKNENYFMNVFGKKLKSLGHLVTPGDRLEYLIIKNNEELLGNRMITYDMYLEGGYDLDTLYYLEHMLKSPIDQLFSVGHQEELVHYEDLGFHTKRKFLSVKKPITMVIEALKNNVGMDPIREFMID
jgi:DNA polymerase delta subunit 1